MIPPSLLVAGILGVTCPPPPQTGPVSCPQVYQVLGDAQPEEALSILVLSAGFSESDEDLFYFRCGTALMLETLLSEPPFAQFRDSINVYRMDLTTPEPGIRQQQPPSCATCPADPVRNVWTEELATKECAAFAKKRDVDPPYYGKPTREAGTFVADCMELDLEVEMCPESVPACKVSWPADTTVIWPLLGCAPGADVVVVIANLATWSGAGSSTGQPPLSVVSMAGVADPNNRSRLLAHEFGHAVDLLDEYSYAYPGSDLPPFSSKRNLVKQDAGSFGPVIWHDSCDAVPPGLPNHEGCGINCRTSCADCTVPPVTPKPKVALWEGGFYDNCGYFRAESSCVMNLANLTRRYCAGCRTYVKSLFEELMGFTPLASE